MKIEIKKNRSSKYICTAFLNEVGVFGPEYKELTNKLNSVKTRGFGGGFRLKAVFRGKRSKNATFTPKVNATHVDLYYTL